MRILVTGGAGFIGSHAVDLFVDQGHTVAVLDNLSTGVAANVNPDASLHEIDLNDRADVGSLIAEFRPQAVCHYAAQISVPHSFEDPVADATTNIVGLLNLVAGSREAGLSPRFIFASSGGAVYGNAAEFPSSEQTPPNPATPYGLSKWAGEKYLQLLAETWKFPYVILRFSNVYGPRQGSSLETGVCAVFVRQALAGQALTVYGDGSQTRDYVFVGDLARAAALALAEGDGETVNLSSGVETSTKELAEIVAELSPNKVAIQFLPERPGDVPRSWLTPRKAETTLHWRPEVSLQDGLRLTLRAH